MLKERQIQSPSPLDSESNLRVWRSLVFDEIDRPLSLYRPDARFIQSALVAGRFFRATFRTFEHPFTQTNPKHLTREHVVTFMTQCAYVHGSMLYCNKVNEPLSDFLRLAHEEQMAIMGIRLRLKKFLPNQDGQSMEQHCYREKVTPSRAYYWFRIGFGKDILGEYEAVIARDRSMLVPS